MYHRRLQSFQCLVDAFIFSQQFEQMTGTVYSRDARCRPLCLFCTVLLLLIHVLLANYVYYIDYARVWFLKFGVFFATTFGVGVTYPTFPNSLKYKNQSK